MGSILHYLFERKAFENQCVVHIPLIVSSHSFFNFQDFAARRRVAQNHRILKICQLFDDPFGKFSSILPAFFINSLWKTVFLAAQRRNFSKISRKCTKIFQFLLIILVFCPKNQEICWISDIFIICQANPCLCQAFLKICQLFTLKIPGTARHARHG